MGALLLLLCLTLLLQGAEPATFTIANSCDYTVWPGILSNAGSSPPSTSGFALPPGQSLPVTVASAWSGRIWGRTLCSTDSSIGFTCATGDCSSGAVECSGRGAAPPATLAEFTLAGGTGGDDFYDVSLVDGFNVPMLVTPQTPSPAAANGSCQATGCPADVNKACPADLRVAVAFSGEAEAESEAVACRSACEVFGAARTGRRRRARPRPTRGSSRTRARAPTATRTTTPLPLSPARRPAAATASCSAQARPA